MNGKKKAVQKKKHDGSAEEKIKSAARKLFTERGYDAVKTRDIAAEAGINLALLNYYFRSKEKLFELVMLENLQHFMKIIVSIFGDDSISVDDKIEKIVSEYIDMLSPNPHLPLFILNEMRKDPNKLAFKMGIEITSVRNHFIKQVQENMKASNVPPIHPFHLMANLMGLTIFPFAARPMLQKVGQVSDEQFIELVKERKKLIPVWLKAMMNLK